LTCLPRGAILPRVRAIGLIGACLLVCLVVAAGCGRPAAATRGGINLKPMTPDAASVAVPMFQVRVVRLQHRRRPDAPVEDIWRLLGTANVPHEKRALWEANDLRLGDGAGLAAERLNELLTETPNRQAHVSELLVRENLDFVISLGGERDALDLLWTDAGGRLLGRHFDQALAQFRFVCRTDPADPAVVRIALAPEVLYGTERMRWIRAERGLIQQMGRDAFVLTDLAAEVALRPGRMLAIGGRAPAEGPGLSFGGAVFFECRGPDMWYQTLILTAQRAAPGPATQGGRVPFLPPPKPRPAAGP